MYFLQRMTRTYLFCFLSLLFGHVHAQTGSRHRKLAPKPVSVEPLAVRPLHTVSIVSGTPTILLLRSATSNANSIRPATPPTKQAPSAAFAPAPVRVANPVLVESIRTKPYLLPIDRSAIKGSYPLGISDRKTTHIIFPAKIREFDAGTDYVLAQIPETVTNVLRVKANPKATAFCRVDSSRETNMTVITEDGGFYSFLIRYQQEPEILNINMANNLTADAYTSRSLGINQSMVLSIVSTSPSTDGKPNLSESDLLYQCERIDGRKPFIRNIGASAMRLTSLLTGIYVAEKVMYLQLELRNDSQIDYDPDFIKFYVRDKDVLKRMAAQEIELKPYAHFPGSPKLLRAKTEHRVIYALPLTTLTQDKVMDVELYEKNGGRHLRFQVEPDILLLAKSIYP